ncbi:floral homeotic protein AGAMOUS-like [Bidens hawaiensis]|uniref:floral homeotic protein AGAMOUS-like n=1 Tax=Bidens hawaiensis TaxID=980011 RepID=UPI00404A6327
MENSENIEPDFHHSEKSISFQNDCSLSSQKKPGKEKIEIKRIENKKNRQVTFCKRRDGLFKKAYELCILSDAEVALIIFSSGGRVYEYANNSVRGTIDRYKKSCLDLPSNGSVAEPNAAQFYQHEATKLREQVAYLQNQNRQFYRIIMGEPLTSMPGKDLQNLESKLEKAISKIRARKIELLFGEIERMQKRELELHNSNQFLRAKIDENKRAQQHMSFTPGSSGY